MVATATLAPVASRWHIANMDVLDWAATYSGPKFHALLCDPPYEYGFMGKSWDSSGIAFRADTWVTLAAHLLPGAFGMAFAGARTHHRIACAIEDAGLILHPAIYWVYGSGFPKATRIDTQIDKALGVIGETTWYDRYQDGRTRQQQEEAHQHISIGSGKNGNYRQEAGSLLAKQWAGHRYGLQAMKPAAEPIIVFQKPYEGKPVECITRTGAGALNIDGARIHMAQGDREAVMAKANKKPTTNNIISGFGNNTFEAGDWSMQSGRWPANLVLSHMPECRLVGSKQIKAHWGESRERTSSEGTLQCRRVKHDRPIGYADVNGMETVEQWACVDGCPVKAMGEQTGERRSAGLYPSSSIGTGAGTTYLPIKPQGKLYEDQGTAARFFHNVDWSYEVAEQLAGCSPFLYMAKASRSERDAGLATEHAKHIVWGDGLNSATKVRTTAQQANGVDRGICRNPHPTVKPIGLTRWLATLLLPPALYAPRRILVPFAGVLSEGAGALLAGWEEIEAVESDTESGYVPIGEARMRYWTSQGQQQQLSFA